MLTTQEAFGLQLPATGIWTIDPGHAEVGFIGRHFGLTRIRGRFVDLSGALVVADDPSDPTVEVTINTATVDSGDQARDDHLRSADFFDVEKHPQAHFRSTSVHVDGSRIELVGDLTIKDVTRPVRLDVEYRGVAIDPWHNERVVFSARGRIDREDWGLTWNMLLEAGGLLVSKEIAIEIEVELIRQAV